MTVKELEEIKEWEYVLLHSLRLAEKAKKKIIQAFDLCTIEYDEVKDEILFVGDGGDDDVIGTRFVTLHSVEAMVQDGWVDVEEKQ